VTAPKPTRLDRSVLLADLRLALVVAALAVVGFGVSLSDEFHLSLVGSRASAFVPGPRALLEVAVETLPLTFRRTSPLAVFVVVAVASLTTQELNHHPEPLPLGVLVALYTLVLLRRPLVSGLAAGSYLVAMAAAGLAGLGGVTDDQFYTDLTVVVGTMTLGYAVALSRTRASLVEQQAAEAARVAEARTREAVEREKARIARDMHDILAHHLSVMVAQAAAARRLSATRPEAPAEALGHVEAVGRDALSGLRRIVGLLRLDRDEPDVSGQPGLDRLDALVEQVRRAGLPVELSIDGRRRPLPEEVEASAFRIVQEGLTNSLKHGSDRVRVTLSYGESALGIEVRDERTEVPLPQDGARNGADRHAVDGYGLVSMRQRVALLGGELAAGPHGAGGFRVAARLPVTGGVG
jgi:signal transduction histidine kinase